MTETYRPEPQSCCIRRKRLLFQVVAHVLNQRIHIGYFRTEREAIAAKLSAERVVKWIRDQLPEKRRTRPGPLRLMALEDARALVNDQARAS